MGLGFYEIIFVFFFAVIFGVCLYFVCDFLKGGKD